VLPPGSAEALPPAAYWLRLRNVEPLYLERVVPLSPLRLLWKLEHMGCEPGVQPYLGGSVREVERLAAALVDSGHTTVVYTFTSQARSRLRAEIPALDRLPLEVIPLAQRKLLATPPLRRGPGLNLGAGGIADPAKGLDQVVRWFTDRWQCSDAATLTLAVIPRLDGQSAADVLDELRVDPRLVQRGQVRVLVGDYGQWPRMCAFYRSLDAMIVNSRADSWGRMLSEAIGWGVPTLVRRAACGTNFAWRGLALFDDLEDVSQAEFLALLDRARAAAPGLRRDAHRHYALDRVLDVAVGALLRHTEPKYQPEVRRLAGEGDNRARLSGLLVF
jgi:hypothetical protein